MVGLALPAKFRAKAGHETIEKPPTQAGHGDIDKTPTSAERGEKGAGGWEVGSSWHAPSPGKGAGNDEVARSMWQGDRWGGWNGDHSNGEGDWQGGVKGEWRGKGKGDWHCSGKGDWQSSGKGDWEDRVNGDSQGGWNGVWRGKGKGDWQGLGTPSPGYHSPSPNPGWGALQMALNSPMYHNLAGSQQQGMFQPQPPGVHLQV